MRIITWYIVATSVEIGRSRSTIDTGAHGIAIVFTNEYDW